MNRKIMFMVCFIECVLGFLTMRMRFAFEFEFDFYIICDNLEKRLHYLFVNTRNSFHTLTMSSYIHVDFTYFTNEPEKFYSD